jgi:uncharacterized phage protein gp47/JayE
MTLIYTKTKSEILDQIINSLEKNAGITATSPGSIARAFAEAVSDQIGDLYTILKYNVDQTMISTASGRNLDLIGELYSVPRKLVSQQISEDRNIANVIFSINKPYSKDIIISKDTLIYNDISATSSLQFQYKLVGDVTIPTGSKRAYGQITAAFSDRTYTASIGSLTRHNFIPPPGIVLSVVNTKEVYNQIDYESDDAYRKRIIRSIKINAVGTSESIRLATLSIKGVRDVRIREGSYGMGSCDVVVIPESPSYSATLDKSVYQELLKIKPIGVRMNVRVAQRVQVSLSANILLSAGQQSLANNGIANQAAYFAKRYLNSFTVGDILDINILKGQIMAASDLISDVVINSISVNGVEIPKENFQLQTERSYMVAGIVEIYPAIIGYTQ